MELDTLSGIDDCTKLMWQYKYFRQLLELEQEGLLTSDCIQFLMNQNNNSIVQIAKIALATDKIDTLKGGMGYIDAETGGNEDLLFTLDSIRLLINNTVVMDSCLAILNTVNKVRLNQIEIDSISFQEIQTLIPIAESCPEYSGDGVYIARGLLSMYLSDDFPTFEDCVSGSIEPRSINKKAYDQKLTIFPNPATDQITVSFNLKDNESGKLIILDIAGNQIYMKNISNDIDELKIGTNIYSSGIYIVKYISDTGKEDIRKLVITK